MDSLHLSRFTKNQITSKLVNLSPEKYNRSAWVDLTYTPSKLTNNVLYRQVTNLKKEEGQLKIRQYQTMNYDFIKQKLIKTQLERDGIYSSLNQQIVMYKNMLHQTQMKHEVRLKQLQIRFDQQISLLIQQKREEVKFILEQKQTFQGRIYELQLQLKQAIERWNSLNSSYKNLEHVHSSLIVISEKYKQLQREKANQQEDALRKQQQLKKNMYKIQQSYAQKIQNLQLQKAKTKQGFERLMKIEIEKIQNVRMNQNYQKGQELRQVLVNFERETKRLNQIILMKDRLIENLNIQNKEKFFKNTQIYQLKIEEQNKNNLILTSQIEQFRRRVFQLQSDIKNQIASRISQKDHFNAHFAKLQEQLQLNKINFVRQRQQISYRSSDLQKQIMRLKNQNMRYSDVLRENEMLSIEIRNLRDLLVQSSYQIDRSTQQLHRISFQRDNLALKNQMVMQQQDRMCLLKRSLESQGCCKPKTIQTCRRKCSCKH